MNYRETIIDGYNLLHKLPKTERGESLADARDRLEALLSGYRQKSRRHVTVVYDGGSGPKSMTARGAIDVTFSGTFKSADRWIIDHVRSLGARAGLTLVITSDREIQRHVTAGGARCIDSETFIDELSAMGILIDENERRERQRRGKTMQKTASEPMSDSEVDYWLRLFGRTQ